MYILRAHAGKSQPEDFVWRWSELASEKEARRLVAFFWLDAGRTV